MTRVATERQQQQRNRKYLQLLLISPQRFFMHQYARSVMITWSLTFDVIHNRNQIIANYLFNMVADEERARKAIMTPTTVCRAMHHHRTQKAPPHSN